MNVHQRYAMGDSLAAKHGLWSEEQIDAASRMRRIADHVRACTFVTPLFTVKGAV